jgi:hypothetical protein
MLRQARDHRLPTRPQKWEGTKTGKGEFDEDPNARVINAANAFLFFFEEHKAGRSHPDDRAKADNCLSVLRRWQTELSTVIDLQQQLDAAINTFRKGAPLRITE